MSNERMTPMKKLMPLLLLALLASGAAEAATRERVPLGSMGGGGRVGIAATVNDEVITISDVDNRVKLYLSGSPAQPPPEILRRMRAQVLDKMIDEKLELKEAKSLGITVGEDQLAEAFAQVAKQNNFTADEFKKRLALGGVRASTLNEQLKAEIAWSQVVRRKLRPQINVSESDIDSTIDQIARNRSKPQYHVAEIYLTVASAAQDASVKQDAMKLVEQISKGAHFSDVAREFSQAPGAAGGGDLGWIQEGQLDPKIDAALKQMQPGQISPPVRTDGGYHILFLRDLQQPGGAAPQKQAAAAPEPAAASVPSVVLNLKQIVIAVDPTDPAPIVAAKIARAQSLKSEIASCDDMDKKAKDFSSEGTGDLGRTPLSALAPDIRKAVGDLKTGELSQPVRTDKGIAVLMVCGREEHAAAPMAADAPVPGAAPPIPRKDDQGSREEVANKIGMQRLDQMQDRYLRDLRATAFIEKRI